MKEVKYEAGKVDRDRSWKNALNKFGLDNIVRLALRRTDYRQ